MKINSGFQGYNGSFGTHHIVRIMGVVVGAVLPALIICGIITGNFIRPSLTSYNSVCQKSILSIADKSIISIINAAKSRLDNCPDYPIRSSLGTH